MNSKTFKNKRKSSASSSDNDCQTKAKKGHWSKGLLQAMDDSDLKIFEDDKVSVIKDKYPKALHHFLILPKENIPNLKSLTINHLDLLEHMKTSAKKLISEYPNSDFKMGFHAIPSMSHLHMHLISNDMNSSCLKTKKHYNSFTTDYFIDIENILKKLKNNGTINDINVNEMKKCLQNNLKCHICGITQKNMPTLKLHLEKEEKQKKLK